MFLLAFEMLLSLWNLFYPFRLSVLILSASNFRFLPRSFHCSHQKNHLFDTFTCLLSVCLYFLAFVFTPFTEQTLNLQVLRMKTTFTYTKNPGTNCKRLCLFFVCVIVCLFVCVFIASKSFRNVHLCVLFCLLHHSVQINTRRKKETHTHRMRRNSPFVLLLYVFMMYQEWWYYSRLNALNGFKTCNAQRKALAHVPWYKLHKNQCNILCVCHEIVSCELVCLFAHERSCLRSLELKQPKQNHIESSYVHKRHKEKWMIFMLWWQTNALLFSSLSYSMSFSLSFSRCM